MSPENPFIIGSKSQRSRYELQKHCRRGSMHSCECWLFWLSYVEYWAGGFGGAASLGYARLIETREFTSWTDYRSAVANE